MLGFLILHGYNYSCRYMGDPHSRICSIYTLTAMSSRPEDINPYILRVYNHIYLLSLREYCNSCGRCMHTARGFSLRDPLNPVNPALKFKLTVNSLPFY